MGLLHREVLQSPDVLLLQDLEPFRVRGEVGDVIQDLIQKGGLYKKMIEHTMFTVIRFILN
jgi:hypothetical protein